MEHASTYRVIGLMSGTSLDGVDMALVIFRNTGDQWQFSIECAQTHVYSDSWKQKLQDAHQLSAEEISALDMEYGHFLGTLLQEFMDKQKVKADLIASHGHTIFHNPSKGYTLQIGNANAIMPHVNLPIISNFRPLDIAYGGQGAPLVPFGDKYLFASYAACINLGGFANISIQALRPVAYDICPVNYVLNHLAQRLGKTYDDQGKIARQGRLNASLLQELNSTDYYSLDAPKSLGREWVEKQVFPYLMDDAPENLLRTFSEHIAIQIAQALHGVSGKVLITGGGTYNAYLIELLEQKTPCQIVVPDSESIEYKEALIFAFLGLRRHLGQSNFEDFSSDFPRVLSLGTEVLPAIESVKE
jgi:anhydro-N-acetylmuramic acid kinase